MNEGRSGLTVGLLKQEMENRKCSAAEDCTLIIGGSFFIFNFPFSIFILVRRVVSSSELHL
jgi:hypothetical protein